MVENLVKTFRVSERAAGLWGAVCGVGGLHWGSGRNDHPAGGPSCVSRLWSSTCIFRGTHSAGYSRTRDSRSVCREPADRDHHRASLRAFAFVIAEHKGAANVTTRWLSPYRAILSARFRMLLQYRAAALAGLWTQIFFGLVLLTIYEAFYRSTMLRQPMTFAEIVTYVWLGQALLAMLPWNADAEIRAMIRSGAVAYELCRPIDLYSLWSWL